MQKTIFPQKIQKVCVLQRRACIQIQNFKRNYLENYNDSEHAVKTKNAPFFMIFPNISFFHMAVNYWTGPLSIDHKKISLIDDLRMAHGCPRSSMRIIFLWSMLKIGKQCSTRLF